jgi:hypothetical protein
MRLFLQLCWPLSVACLVFASGCSVQGSQSTVPPAPVRPSLTELVPNTVTPGSSGTVILRGANFAASISISTPPGLALRNVRVDSATEITADYAVASNSVPGNFEVTVTTPAGTSDPARFRIVPVYTQFGSLRSFAKPAVSQPPFESFDVGIHAAPVATPDGSETDAYLDISFSDDKGRPVEVGDSYHSDMDNVVSPDDPEPGPNVTSYSFAMQRPEAGEYVLDIKGSRSGSFRLEIDTSTSSSHDDLAELNDVPTYSGSEFQLKFVCRRDPFTVNIDGGGLQPPHGAFSFAQPLASVVHLPSGTKMLGVAIYYDPLMDPSSFRGSLEGSDVTAMFHVRLGELELVSVPLEPGQHNLTLQANTKSGLSTEQEFHIQH